jgi:hypothetical protein
MYKKISSVISWVCNKTRKCNTPDESEEREGGLGAPYRPRTDDYYSNHGKGERGAG